MTTPPDAVIVGGGLIGLACAAAIAREGGTVIVLDSSRAGTASPAAAGMLAPSVERTESRADAFARAARDRYPTYVEELAEATGIRVPLNREGILQVALSENGVRGLRRAMPASATWLDREEIREAEPAVGQALGAVHHPHDGAVDNGALLGALRRMCDQAPRVRWHASPATEVVLGTSGVRVRAADGETNAAAYVVIAAGAWSAQLDGLPRPVPITPLRGQMLAYNVVSVRHVVFGPRGYVVPRTGYGGSAPETLVGATSESVGFDTATTPRAARSLHDIGSEIVPHLDAMRPTRQWAGLRPMTPDLLPILGPDPDEPRVLYACGHSRNGILLAPLTGDCIAALALERPPTHDLSAFRIGRFGNS